MPGFSSAPVVGEFLWWAPSSAWPKWSDVRGPWSFLFLIGSCSSTFKYKYPARKASGRQGCRLDGDPLLFLFPSFHSSVSFDLLRTISLYIPIFRIFLVREGGNPNLWCALGAAVPCNHGSTYKSWGGGSAVWDQWRNFNFQHAHLPILTNAPIYASRLTPST
jgi:hypothetical protein